MTTIWIIVGVVVVVAVIALIVRKANRQEDCVECELPTSPDLEQVVGVTAPKKARKSRKVAK